jgi:hypothetical protein
MVYALLAPRALAGAAPGALFHPGAEAATPVACASKLVVASTMAKPAIDNMSLFMAELRIYDPAL